MGHTTRDELLAINEGMDDLVIDTELAEQEAEEARQRAIDDELYMEQEDRDHEAMVKAATLDIQARGITLEQWWQEGGKSIMVHGELLRRGVGTVQYLAVIEPINSGIPGSESPDFSYQPSSEYGSDSVINMTPLALPSWDAYLATPGRDWSDGL